MEQTSKQHLLSLKRKLTEKNVEIVRDGSVVILHLVLYLKNSLGIILPWSMSLVLAFRSWVHRLKSQDRQTFLPLSLRTCILPTSDVLSPFNLSTDFLAFSSSVTVFLRIRSFKAQFCLVLRTLRDVSIKQRGLFSNTPKCDTPFHGAGVAGSTVM